MATVAETVVIVDIHQLAAVVRNRIDNVLIIDSRSFLEFNTCHVIGAANVCSSKIVKRRLQQDKVTVKELLAHTCQCDLDDNYDIVVYDQASKDAETIPKDTFLYVLLQKLLLVFRSVNLVSGGFLEFQSAYGELCEDKTRKCTPLTSLSQPCLSISNQGPTRILPFLYLGSQNDSLNREMLKDHNITYELNVSTSCPKPEHIQDAQFLRISVNDNYSEKLLPHFPRAFQFLDKVRESSANVLVHCLAGISRSPTVAIAYVMRHMRMTSDDAYRYVKSKRVTISPNFNFLGQLLEYEKQLRKDKILEGAQEPKSAPILSHSQKRLCRTDMRKSVNLTLKLPKIQQNAGVVFGPKSGGDQSPTTALAKLSFANEKASPTEEEEKIVEDSSPLGVLQRGQGPPQWPKPAFFSTGGRISRSNSCANDWVSSSVKEDSKVERMECQVVPRRKCFQDIIKRDQNKMGTTLNNFVSSSKSTHPGKSITYLRTTEGVLPNTLLDTLSQVEEIECEQDETEVNEESSKPVGNKRDLKGLEGIPVSSLKELNFTSCQTSLGVLQLANRIESLVKELTNKQKETEEIETELKMFCSYSLSKSKTSTSFNYKQTKEKTFWEGSGSFGGGGGGGGHSTSSDYSSEASSSSSNTTNSSNSSGSGLCYYGKSGSKYNQWFGLQSPVSETQIDLKTKEYNRSDSASTSGLGSESSDNLDTWSECPSSNCGDSEEYQAVFRSLSCLDDDDNNKGERTTETTSKASRIFSSKFSLSLPNDKTCSGLSVAQTETVKSPLSPSESHFLEDIDAEDDAEEVSLKESSGKLTKSELQWKRENELESSQDSGILSSPLWDVPEFKSSLPEKQATSGRKDSITILSDSSSSSVNLRKRKQESFLYESKSGSSSSSSPPRVSTVDSNPSSKVSLDPQIHIPKSVLVSGDGLLYRAQSCPGILCWFPQRTSSSERLSPLFKSKGVSRNLSSLEEFVVPPSFMRHRERGAPNKEQSAKFQNRYSCGSLDQYNYELYSKDAFHFSSGPGLYNKDGSRGSLSSIAAAANSAAAERASLSPSHRLFRASVDMIQVS